MPHRLILTLLAALFVLAGCGGMSTIKTSWRDDSDTAGTPRKLAVFVAVKDENLRRMAENRVVQSLQPGMPAEAAHQLGLDVQIETPDVRNRLTEAGFDAALLARLVSVDKTRALVPAQPPFLPEPFLWRRGPYPYSPFYPFHPFYPYAYATPPQVVEDTRVIVETLLYRLPEGRPVWTAVSESFNPASSNEVVEDLIQLIGKRLRDEGLLPGRQGKR